MTPKAENAYLKIAASFLAGTLMSLGVYIYTHDQDQVSGDLDEVQTKVSNADTEMHKTKDDLLEKVYNLSLMSNEKIGELQKSDIRAEGQYKLLEHKVDNMIKSSEANRILYMSKFEAHDKRIAILEEHDEEYAKALAEYRASKKEKEERKVGLFGGVNY